MTNFRKSSFCDSGACVEVGFTKASFSGDQNGCVEVNCNCHNDEVLVRDSKNPDGPVLRFNTNEWSAFVRGVLAGEFDL